jgi:uncharacterized OB-fold protein
MSTATPANFVIPTEPGRGPVLLGSRCRSCGTVVFPRMPVCPRCLRNGTMEETELGRTGRLYSHTIAHFAPQGFIAPFFQVFVDLPEGPRIFSLVGAEVPVGPGVLEDRMEMRLVVEPVAATPENKDRLTYKYVPVKSASSKSLPAESAARARRDR